MSIRLIRRKRKNITDGFKCGFVGYLFGSPMWLAPKNLFQESIFLFAASLEPIYRNPTYTEEVNQIMDGVCDVICPIHYLRQGASLHCRTTISHPFEDILLGFVVSPLVGLF